MQGPLPLSQGLDLGGQKLSLGTLPFLGRTEDNICFGGGLQEHGDLTSRTKDLTPRSLQQLTTPLSYLSYKRALLKTFGEFGFFFFFFFNKFIYLFIYFWLHWVFVAAHGLSLVVVSGGYSSLWCAGFSLWWLPLLRSTGSWHVGFSSCGTQAQ